MIFAVFAATAPETRFDASHLMEVVHGIQLRAETAERHCDLDDVREVPLDGFGS